MNTKICSKCGEEKPLSEFHKHKLHKDGHVSHCKSCVLIKVKEHYNENKNKKLEYQKEYYKNNKDNVKQYKKEYFQNNKKKINKKNVHRRKIDINYKIVSYLRNRLVKALRGYSKSKRTLELLGCTISHFKLYLEIQFPEGMTFDNYGEWHIDHIIPCDSFDLSDPEQQKQCFHYSNLQPLWALDNLQKSNKIS